MRSTRLMARADSASRTSFNRPPARFARLDRQAQTSQTDDSGQAEFGGFCLRTPFPPGIVRFEGCSATQLARYRILPEHGDQPVQPQAGVAYDADGVWSADHVPANGWFKVPSHCDATLHCSGGSFTSESCCNAAASLFKGSPRWVTDDHEALKNLPSARSDQR